MALKAGVDDVFRLVRFVGLRNEAAAAGERVLNGGREMGKGAHGKMADEVGSGVAVDGDLAGGVERMEPESCGRMRGRAERKAARTKQQHRFESRANHGKTLTSTLCRAQAEPQPCRRQRRTQLRSGLPVLRVKAMRSCVLRSPQRERKASRSRSRRYCSVTSVPGVMRPPARMYAAQRATF